MGYVADVTPACVVARLDVVLTFAADAGLMDKKRAAKVSATSPGPSMSSANQRMNESAVFLVSSMVYLLNWVSIRFVIFSLGYLTVRVTTDYRSGVFGAAKRVTAVMCGIANCEK